MSEENDDKTESASAKRLQQARDEGQLPIGRDVVALAGLGAGALALSAAAPAIGRALVAMVSSALRVDQQPIDFIESAKVPIALGFAVCAAAALGAVMATFAQTGGGFWPELPMPDPTRVFSPQRLTKLFKLETLADLGLASLKVAVIGASAWSTFRADLLTLPARLADPAATILAAMFAPLLHAGVKVLAAMLVLAGVDFAVARYRFAVRMRMTREEAKREHKEDEGDPMLRSRRRRRHRDLAKGNARKEVPRADALIVNPTHIAIAIRYRRGEDGAPRVMAKGKGKLAEHMRELAREHGIPIVQEIPLARLLYKRVKVGREVPAETFRAVAAVLAFVYRVTGRKGGMAA